MKHVSDSDSEWEIDEGEESESEDEEKQKVYVCESSGTGGDINNVKTLAITKDDQTIDEITKKYRVCVMCYECKYGIVLYSDRNRGVVSSRYCLNENQGVWNLFNLPYFKSTIDEGNFMVAPAIDDVVRCDTPLPFRLTALLQKPSWPTGDVHKLEKFVIDSIRETFKINLKYHFLDCLDKMNLSKKEMDCITQCTSENELIDAAVKISVDREVTDGCPPSYSPVMCYIQCPGRRLTARSEKKTLLDLLHFRLNYSKKLEQMDFTEISENFPIDWLSVSQKMFNLGDRWTTPEECKKIWDWNLQPRVKKESFSTAEIEEFTEVMYLIGPCNKWHLINEHIDKGRSDMDYLQLSTIMPKTSAEYPMSCELREELIDLYFKYQDFNILAAKLNDVFPQMNIGIARTIYKTNLNPMLRKANYTPIEDAILVVAMEVEKEEMLKEDSDFYIIVNWMPWRYNTSIIDRFNRLFNPERTPFTLEEDKLLIAAVELMGKEWNNISSLFESNKGRKACEARYNYLMKLNKDLDDHHAAVNNKPQSLVWSSPLVRCLHKLVKVLQTWNNCKLIERSKLSRNYPPTEADLHRYIRSFPKIVVQKTLDKIIAHCHQNLKYLPVERKAPPCDRRKFERNVPASWASILHLRRIELKPLDEIDNPTDFELEIYAHFHKYGDGRRPKSSIRTNILPPANELVRYPEVSRIVYDKREEALKQCTINTFCNIKSERLKLEREEAEVYTGYNYLEAPDEFSGLRVQGDSASQVKNETVVQDIKYIPPPMDSEDFSPSTKIKRTRGPKKGYMKKVRRAAAKARWDKAENNKNVGSKTDVAKALQSSQNVPLDNRGCSNLKTEFVFVKNS